MNQRQRLILQRRKGEKGQRSIGAGCVHDESLERLNVKTFNVSGPAFYVIPSDSNVLTFNVLTLQRFPFLFFPFSPLHEPDVCFPIGVSS